MDCIEQKPDTLQFKVSYARPLISLVDYDDSDTDRLLVSGYYIKRLLRETIDCWNLEPRVVRDNKGRVAKVNQNPYWCAYRDILLNNQFHPEDVVTLHKHLSEGFQKAITLKLEAIEELKQNYNDDLINNEQCQKLIGFLEETLKHLQNDRCSCLTQLLDLIMQLQQQHELWETPQ